MMSDDAELDDLDSKKSKLKPKAGRVISRDLTSLPAELDAKYLEVDPEGMLRPTIIKVDPDRQCSKVRVCHAVELCSVSVWGSMHEVRSKRERAVACKSLGVHFHHPE